MDQPVHPAAPVFADLGGSGVFRLCALAHPAIARMLQPQRPAHQLLHQRVQRLAAAALHGNAHEDQAKIGIEHRIAGAVGKGHGADIVHGLLRRFAAQMQRRPAQAGIMHQHIAPSDHAAVAVAQQLVRLILQQRVGAGADLLLSREGGEALADGLVQIKNALSAEGHEGRPGKELAQRRDIVAGVLPGRQPGDGIGAAIGLLLHQLIMMKHAERGGGKAALRDKSLNMLVQSRKIRHDEASFLDAEMIRMGQS